MFAVVNGVNPLWDVRLEGNIGRTQICRYQHRPREAPAWVQSGRTATQGAVRRALKPSYRCAALDKTTTRHDATRDMIIPKHDATRHTARKARAIAIAGTEGHARKPAGLRMQLS